VARRRQSDPRRRQRRPSRPARMSRSSLIWRWKSSLVGLLLGWHRAAAGRISSTTAAGRRRRGGGRRVIAWVDPAVHVWNRAFVDNLCYGSPAGLPQRVGAAIEMADLVRVLQKMPDGLQTPLGESGSMVSGGEGQRVRLGRALLRPDVRLAISTSRSRARARTTQRAAGPCPPPVEGRHAAVHHADVGETRGFDRVLVIEEGRIVGDGSPAELANQQDSRYRQLLEAEESVLKAYGRIARQRLKPRPRSATGAGGVCAYSDGALVERRLQKPVMTSRDIFAWRRPLKRLGEAMTALGALSGVTTPTSEPPRLRQPGRAGGGARAGAGRWIEATPSGSAWKQSRRRFRTQLSSAPPECAPAIVRIPSRDRRAVRAILGWIAAAPFAAHAGVGDARVGCREAAAFLREEREARDGIDPMPCWRRGSSTYRRARVRAALLDEHYAWRTSRAFWLLRPEPSSSFAGRWRGPACGAGLRRSRRAHRGVRLLDPCLVAGRPGRDAGTT